MSEHLDFYKCELCGTIIQVMKRGDGELVCCGKPMTYLKPHTAEEEKREKHVPVLINGNKIQVGSEPHPMLPEHHIAFIESVSEDKKHVEIKFLDTSDNPETEIGKNSKPAEMYEYCNLHGLWIGTN